MDPLIRASGTAVALPEANIDTDQIIPAGELVKAGIHGHAPSLFAGRRYTDIEARTENPDFILNREPWRHATVLVAGANFGCGSSREAAVWALAEAGFRVVVAPSFGGIFFNNCFRNGLLPVQLDAEAVAGLIAQVEAGGGQARMAIDLERMVLTAPDGTELPIRLKALDREMLTSGLDQVALTLRRAADIARYREADRSARPWVHGAADPSQES